MKNLFLAFVHRVVLLLASRTFWTLVLTFAFNTFQIYGHKLTPEVWTLVNGILMILAGYFKVNPSQNYQTPTL